MPICSIKIIMSRHRYRNCITRKNNGDRFLPSLVGGVNITPKSSFTSVLQTRNEVNSTIRDWKGDKLGPPETGIRSVG